MMRELSEFYRNFQKSVTEYMILYIIICGAGVGMLPFSENASCRISLEERKVLKNAGYGNFGN